MINKPAMTELELLKKTTMWQVADEVTEICSPLLQLLKFSYFDFEKAFKRQSYSKLG